MTSIGNVTVSHAASGTTPQNNAGQAVRDAGSTSNSSQQAAIAQIAAQAPSQKITEDDKRDVSNQKRTEAGFSSNQDEPHRDTGDASEGSVGKESRSGPGGLSVKV